MGSECDVINKETNVLVKGVTKSANAKHFQSKNM